MSENKLTNKATLDAIKLISDTLSIDQTLSFEVHKGISTGFWGKTTGKVITINIKIEEPTT